MNVKPLTKSSSETTNPTPGPTPGPTPAPTPGPIHNSRSHSVQSRTKKSSSKSTPNVNRSHDDDDDDDRMMSTVQANRSSSSNNNSNTCGIDGRGQAIFYFLLGIFFIINPTVLGWQQHVLTIFFPLIVICICHYVALRIFLRQP